MIPGKFGCTDTYYAQIHKEQTNKLSSLYIRLAEVLGVARENLIQSSYMREKRVLNSTICS